jgi:hypothetical protein
MQNSYPFSGMPGMFNCSTHLIIDHTAPTSLYASAGEEYVKKGKLGLRIGKWARFGSYIIAVAMLALPGSLLNRIGASRNQGPEAI